MAARVIEFVTDDAKVAEMFPPGPAAPPDWYVKASATVEKPTFPGLRLREDVTIKGCPGVADYLGLGYTVPLWADYIVQAEPGGFAHQAAYDDQGISTFTPQQWADVFPRRPDDHDFVLKISTPWRVVTPTGWSILLLSPWYHQELAWEVMPGLIDSDRCATLTAVILWHAPPGKPVLMRAGTPLLQVVPFLRGGLDLDITVGREEFDALAGRGIDGVSRGRRLAPGAYRENARRSE